MRRTASFTTAISAFCAAAVLAGCGSTPAAPATSSPPPSTATAAPQSSSATPATSTSAAGTTAPAATVPAGWKTHTTSDGTLAFDYPETWTVKDPADEPAEGGIAVDLVSDYGKTMASLRTNMVVGAECTEKSPFMVYDSAPVPALAQGGITPRFVYEGRTEPVAADPAAGDPAAGDPAAGDPAAGDPAADDPAAGDPAADAPEEPGADPAADAQADPATDAQADPAAEEAGADPAVEEPADPAADASASDSPEETGGDPDAGNPGPTLTFAYGITSAPEPTGDTACPIFHFFSWPPSGAMFGGAYDPMDTTPGGPAHVDTPEAYKDTPEYKNVKQAIMSLRPAGKP
ncbi:MULTISPECIES: hypothetical protein [unclassified Arthrobacter]|uniref:hypothetical protein n=1 Tax=unclassified Arthrobacter TaxID=235627 RepID=UPI002DF9AFA6|nr:MULTISPECIES: hypothetical protein [unclassified Arthrobacter]MEC5191783.1 hypothetical protein [Arthrobacter sp. MP_M4]MEC5203473.1 hypothetical protein [Arthrobacter sp. MP_M7]